MKTVVLDKIRKNPFLGMAIGCAIPLAAISALSFMGILGAWGFYALMLLCPLLHVWMCREHHTPEQNGAKKSGALVKTEDIDV